MIDHRPTPPQAEACLLVRYPSSQKGGTLIDERVVDLGTHVRLLRNGGYRPSRCPRCSHGFLHIHDYRPRQLVGDPAEITTVVRFWCPGCEACWQILPALVARHLWRSWAVVEHTTAARDAESAAARTVVPRRTRARWLVRLASTAALLVAVFVTAEQPALIAVAAAVGVDGTRGDLVAAYAVHCAPSRGRRLAEPAALLHRLVPGVRLM